MNSQQAFNTTASHWLIHLLFIVRKYWYSAWCVRLQHKKTVIMRKENCKNKSYRCLLLSEPRFSSFLYFQENLHTKKKPTWHWDPWIKWGLLALVQPPICLDFVSKPEPADVFLSKLKNIRYARLWNRIKEKYFWQVRNFKVIQLSAKHWGTVKYNGAPFSRKFSRRLSASFFPWDEHSRTFNGV